MPTNPETLKSTKNHSLKFIALSISREPKSGRLFLAGNDFKVYAVDPTNAKFEPKEIGKHETYVTCVVALEKTVISGGYDGKLNFWDPDKGTAIRSIDAHAKWMRNLALSPDGKLVASVADDMVCKVWETETGKLVHELRGHKEKTPHHFPSMLYACSWSADGKRLATGDKVGKVVIWDANTGKIANELEAAGFYTWDGRQRIHSIGGIRAVAFSPDGKLMATGGIGHIGNIDHLDGPFRIEVLEIQSGKRTHLFDKTKFKGIVNRLHFEPSGAWLVAAGGAGTGHLAFMDLTKNKLGKEESVKFHVHGLTLDQKCEKLYVAGHNGFAEYELKG
jgi:WD40 repeat protein